MSRWRLPRPGHHCLRCMNVCMNGWMLTYVIESFQWSLRLEKSYINTVHLPFNITFPLIEDDAQIEWNIFFKFRINAFCFTGQYMCVMLTFSPDYEEQSTTFCRLSSINSVSKLADIFTCHPLTQKCTIYVGGWSVYLQYSCLGHLCSFWFCLQFVGLCLGASVILR